jgi:hypothetical protein
VDASTSKAIALQISEYSGLAGSSRPDSAGYQTAEFTSKIACKVV